MSKFYPVMSSISFLTAILFSLVLVVQIPQKRELQQAQQQSFQKLLSQVKEKYPNRPDLLTRLQPYSPHLPSHFPLDIVSPEIQIILGFILAGCGGYGLQFLETKMISKSTTME
ncbi:MAG: hypothetical protein GPJ20_10335 [Microcystis aeruginosa BS13-10]|jgi:hypothetical protein|uniref:Uncharacterized protein n=1 Tax=Microcystis aeruginosa G11-04 TaxID=2685956 RepID=A0A966G234_MICAE|nr:hypothetical protein [Microcystis aeruginosa WS75]NCS39326.1 hypothetical protein [Microcystis aeruginosa BS13-10]NCS58035.1 hypothetical protein [Microcystis aeruginosa G11-04]